MGLRALIIDDSAVMRKVVERALRQAGLELLEVLQASNGEEALQVLRADKGETDPLVAHAELRPGDSVLDATLGLGGDALVSAHATGARVVGLESHSVIAAFTQAALRRLPKHGRDPGRLVQVVRADHRAWLKHQPTGAFDIVLLDPRAQAFWGAKFSDLGTAARALANNVPWFR